MHVRRGGQQAVDRRDRVGDVQPAPLLGDLGGNGADAVGVVQAQRGQPGLEDGVPGISAAQPLDPLPDLADHQHAEVQLRPAHRGQPRPNGGVARRLARLRDDVGVQQEAHNSTTRAGDPLGAVARSISSWLKSGAESRKSAKSGTGRVRRR